jgi:proton-translocating NADH-quinone oxidoreductase chain L
MYNLVLLLPFLAFLQACFGGFFLGRDLSAIFSVSLLGLAAVTSWFIFAEVCLGQAAVTYPLYSWLVFDLFRVQFGLFFDSLTATMLVVITTISFLVHLYSTEYMGHDPFLTRFLSFLSLFTFFMLILVTSDNLVQLFLGWEGVGLCSYLLINFWHTRILANKAAIKAMLMNRIADVFFVFAICLCFFALGSCDYGVIFLYRTFPPVAIGSFSFSSIDLICLFLLFGAIGKSAQLGFHTWLPDAMEGPTPVSSLLHAATMVTAGVFLVVRCAPLFEASTYILPLLAFFGGLTAFFSAFVALFQWDLKKVIAYSTCSQLGYMFLACGLSFYSVALFHLFNHAFFKALLFLSAGAIIHALGDEQDMRKMGGLGRFLPFTLTAMVFASLAIMGFPFLTGFYSKDLILELLLASFQINGFFLYSLALAAAFLTATYSFRLLHFVFFYRLNYSWAAIPQESHWAISASLFILALASLVVGFVFSDFYVGWGSSLFSSGLAYPLTDNVYQTILLTPFQRNLPLLLSFWGIFFATVGLRYWKKIIRGQLGRLVLAFYRPLSTFFYHSGFFNTIYNGLFNGVYLGSYIGFTKLLDKGVLEFFGPVGFYRLVAYFSYRLRRWPNFIFFQIGSMFFSVLLWFTMLAVFGILSKGLIILLVVVILIEVSRV